MNNVSVQHKVPVLQVTNHNNAFGSLNPMRKLPKRFIFMDWRQRLLGLLVLLMGLLAAPAAGSNDDDFTQRLHSRGHVLLIRHAEAPGMGDLDGFRLGDCSTQRNLSKAGREQARAVGDWLRDRGIERARVYSSQWCRCLETAELLDLGPVAALPGLNSFFDRPQDRAPNLAALRDFLESQPPRGELLILVTHQVTISALTGQHTASGHGVLANLADGGTLRAIGQIGFGGSEANRGDFP